VIKSGFQLGKKADLDYSRRLTPLAAISLLCALTARPQTPNDPVFRVDVDVRQVDLVVTDAKGHHVTDLGPDDFRIFQDGRPQKMTNFSWIEVTPPPTGAQLAALQKPVSLWERFSGVPTIAKTPGNDIVAAPVVNPHKDEIRRTIAFVMNDHSVGVMNRIRKLIDEQLSPTDMVSIGSTLRSVVPLSHGMAEIRDSMGIFQQFSNDKRQLDAALERIPRTCDFLHTCINRCTGRHHVGDSESPRRARPQGSRVRGGVRGVRRPGGGDGQSRGRCRVCSQSGGNPDGGLSGPPSGSGVDCSAGEAYGRDLGAGHTGSGSHHRSQSGDGGSQRLLSAWIPSRPERSG
jgi:hypothetical protein